MPNTVTAETAATLRAKFLFFSIFFSSFILEIRSVTLTLPCVASWLEWFWKLYCVLIPKYGRHFRKHTNKFSIWIVRLENSPEIKYAYSKPCYYCSKLMKEYGFSKVYFTIDKETILTEKVCELIPTHKSGCQLRSEKVDTNIKFKLF